MGHVLRGGLAAALAVMSGAASAADLPVKTPPAPVAIPTYNWTGFYIGGNAGIAFAAGRYDDTLTGGNFGTGKSDSFVGGGQIGYNYQIGIVVLGLEARFDGLSQSSGVWPATIGGDVFHSSSEVNWTTTVAGRIGISAAAADHWLFYAKGGAGWAGTNSSINDLTAGSSASTSGTRSGWLAGLGVEWAFAPNWTMKIEYSYLGIGSYSVASPFAPGDTFSVSDNNIQTLTVGVNYLFNWGAPIVARY